MADTTSTIMHLTDSTFAEEIFASELPILVDFWADWCGPCKMIAPILEELAVEYAGSLRIAKVDVDANIRIATDLDIRSIPTLILYKDGLAKVTMIGAKGKAQLLQEISAFL